MGALTTPPQIELTLFVAPDSHASALAIEHLRSAVERVGPGAFALEVVDITREPQRLLRERVLVTPTLLASPGRRRVVGDLGNAILLDFFLRSLLDPAREASARDRSAVSQEPGGPAPGQDPERGGSGP